VSRGAAVAGRDDQYRSIQALRFVAAFMVLLCHATSFAAERLDPGFPLYLIGANGVLLFFVISGFVILLSADNADRQPGGWRLFAVKRVIRIVPLYWLVTTVKLAISLAAVSLVLRARAVPGFLVKSYLFVPALNEVSGKVEPFYGVGWTLVFEMLFYLMVTACLALRWSPFRCAALAMPALAAAWFFRPADAPALFFYADPIVLDFLAGMVAARLVGRGRFLGVAPSVLGIVAGLSYLFVPGFPMFDGNPYWVHQLLAGLSSFLVVYGCASLEKTSRLPVPNVVMFFGAASYSLYLTHPIVGRIAPDLLSRAGLLWPWMSVALSVAASLFGAAVVYRAVERPATKALNGLAMRWLAAPRPALRSLTTP
jgi:peptidoglycan/LPS O-acetylase OafA/YrhL